MMLGEDRIENEDIVTDACWSVCDCRANLAKFDGVHGFINIGGAPIILPTLIADIFAVVRWRQKVSLLASAFDKSTTI